jgi:hypothetical protein
MQAALVPTLQGLAGNQNIRRRVGQIAKQGGKLAWNAAIRGIQARRRRRNRTILFPGGVKPIWTVKKKNGGNGGGNVVMANQQVAVRTNSGVSGQSSTERVIASEMTAILPPIPVGTEHVDYYFVTPNKSELWPALHTKAKTFTRYCIDSLTFNFAPVAGSAINGTLYMAWTNDIDQAHGGLSTQDLQGFSVFKMQSLSSPFSMTVPAVYMNRGSPAGQLHIDDYMFTESSADGSLYYAGIFFVATKDLSAQSGTPPTSLGTITVRYNVSLKMTQNPSTPNGYQVSFDADGAPLTRPGGEVGVFLWGDSLVHLSSNRPMNLIVRDTKPEDPAPDLLEITWDDEVLTPVLQVGTHNRISVFQLTSALNAVLSWVFNDPTTTFIELTKTNSRDVLWSDL